MNIVVEGFILSEVPYGETSKIINVLTREYGIIGLMAKGAKSVKSKLRAFTTKFTFGNFFICYKENKLSILKSVDIINPLNNIRSDLLLTGYITYLTDLTMQVIKENNNIDEIYDLFINTVLKIENKLDPMVLSNILEIKYLDYLGVPLSLTKCSLCGSVNNIVTIDASKGGFICQNCYTNEPVFSSKILKILRMYYVVDIRKITSLNIEEDIKKSINNFLGAFYDDYTGVYVYSKKFLDNILNL